MEIIWYADILVAETQRSQYKSFEEGQSVFRGQQGYSELSVA
jgi:hypothetical protein